MSKYRICPSILNADLTNLDSEITRIASNSDLLHLDIMDNIFVPNKTFEFAESERIIKSSPLPVDVHLMISDPDASAVQYAQAGAKSVTFHFEAAENVGQIAENIKKAGSRVGLAIKPGTAFSEIEDYLPVIDMVLVMTVEPGFGGQAFMEDMMPKVREVRTALTRLPEPTPWLQVDGGITLETIIKAAQAGADTFVAGSAVFKSPEPAQMIDDLKSLLAQKWILSLCAL